MLIRDRLCHRSASVVLMELIYNTIYSSLRRAKQNVALIWLTKPAFLTKDSAMRYECAKWNKGWHLPSARLAGSWKSVMGRHEPQKTTLRLAGSGPCSRR